MYYSTSLLCCCWAEIICSVLYISYAISCAKVFTYLKNVPKSPHIQNFNWVTQRRYWRSPLSLIGKWPHFISNLRQCCIHSHVRSWILDPIFSCGTVRSTFDSCVYWGPTHWCRSRSITPGSEQTRSRFTQSAEAKPWPANSWRAPQVRRRTAWAFDADFLLPSPS